MWISSGSAVSNETAKPTYTSICEVPFYTSLFLLFLHNLLLSHHVTLIYLLCFVFSCCFSFELMFLQELFITPQLCVSNIVFGEPLTFVIIFSAFPIPVTWWCLCVQYHYVCLFIFSIVQHFVTFVCEKCYINKLYCHLCLFWWLITFKMAQWIPAITHLSGFVTSEIKHTLLKLWTDTCRPWTSFPFPWTLLIEFIWELWCSSPQSCKMTSCEDRNIEECVIHYMYIWSMTIQSE